MLATLVITILAGQSFLAEDWVAFYRFSVDDGCTLAHDRVSGAVVRYCNSPVDAERIAKEFVSDETHRFGPIEIRVLEYNEPDRDIRRLRAAVGEEEIVSTCWVGEFFKAYDVPPVCEREFLFIAPTRDGRAREYKLVACSDRQVARALEYVHAVTLNLGPAAVDVESYGQTRPIVLADVEMLRSPKSLAHLLSEYGPPDQVWPRYPDGFSLIYPVLGTKAFGVVAHFDRDRQIHDAALLCPNNP